MKVTEMKVIDLLNEVANGELKNIEKFKINSFPTDVWTIRDYKLFNETGREHYFGLEELNHEIEIIEEDKSIKKINVVYQEGHNQDEINEYLRTTINEIIDKVNELERK